MEQTLFRNKMLSNPKNTKNYLVINPKSFVLLLCTHCEYSLALSMIARIGKIKLAANLKDFPQFSLFFISFHQFPVRENAIILFYSSFWKASVMTFWVSLLIAILFPCCLSSTQNKFEIAHASSPGNDTYKNKEGMRKTMAFFLPFFLICFRQTLLVFICQ